jgi:hypothetical protein
MSGGGALEESIEAPRMSAHLSGRIRQPSANGSGDPAGIGTWKATMVIEIRP